MAEQIFYGYFESPEPDAMPEYDPPHDAPCPYCGKPVHAEDVRTPSLMYFDSMSASSDGEIVAVRKPYAARCYFYRTHRSCEDRNKELPETERFNADDFILSMIRRNGD